MPAAGSVSSSPSGRAKVSWCQSQRQRAIRKCQLSIPGDPLQGTINLFPTSVPGCTGRVPLLMTTYSLQVPTVHFLAGPSTRTVWRAARTCAPGASGVLVGCPRPHQREATRVCFAGDREQRSFGVLTDLQDSVYVGEECKWESSPLGHTVRDCPPLAHGCHKDACEGSSPALHICPAAPAGGGSTPGDGGR